MTFTPPDLSQVLTNEQTMNSRLTTCRNDLRAILTKEEIGYTQGDGVIPLIRKLPVPVLASVNVNIPNKFSTGRNVSAYISATDTKGDAMANATLNVYRIDADQWNEAHPVSLGTVTTDSNGQATVSVPMPNDKGYFYVQARSGNIYGGDFGVYCTTAINGNEFTYSKMNSGLFSANGYGGSSGFMVMDYMDEDGYVDVVVEAHNGYSGNYFGIALTDLGGFTKTTMDGHKFIAILSEIGNGTKSRVIAFGLAFNVDSWANLGIGAGGKYWYGDGTGSAGYRQVFQNVQSMSSDDNGNPEPAGEKLYMVDCSWAYYPTVIDEYDFDPTEQYPDNFTNHGTWNCSQTLFPSGTAYPSIIFNYPDNYSNRMFRFYGAGVI